MSRTYERRRRVALARSRRNQPPAAERPTGKKNRKARREARGESVVLGTALNTVQPGESVEVALTPEGNSELVKHLALSEMSVGDLREVAKNHGIKGVWRMNKSHLIEAIKEATR